MPEFIHKPTRVRAERYDGPGALSPGFAAAICQGTCPHAGTRYRDEQPLPHIDTLHGPVQLEAGWWVLPESDGIHFYPVSPEEFAARYEPVPS